VCLEVLPIFASFYRLQEYIASPCWRSNRSHSQRSQSPSVALQDYFEGLLPRGLPSEHGLIASNITAALIGAESFGQHMRLTVRQSLSFFFRALSIVRFDVFGLAVGILLSMGCFAQNTLPPAGHAAPEMELSQVLQAPAGTQPVLTELRGKAVVLEFWATWCGGCVAAIPHLNELAKKFKDKPVVFLSVTDEGPDVVQAFLRKRPMGGWVGIDKDDATFRKYGIDGRPRTILIDAQGILRALASPERLDPAMIDRLIAGMPIEDDVKLNRLIILPMEFKHGVPPPLLQFLIRPAASVSVSGFSPGAVAQTDDGRVQYFGMKLRTLLAYTESVREDRIIAPEWFDQDRYDVSTLVPKGMDELRGSLMRQMIAATFQLQTRRETKPVSVYVLNNAPGLSGKLHVSNAKPSEGFLSHPGQFTGVATPVSRLIHALGRELGGTEVIDDTGLSGIYDFDLSWRKGDLESLQVALHDQLGMTLVRQTRNREFFVVVAAAEPKTF
jgi:uncharacterized protein (TIGR03435 family)